MSIINLLKRASNNRICQHISFWLAIYLFHVITYGSYTDKWAYESIINLILTPIRAGITYITIYLLIPKLLFKRKYFLFLVILIINIAVFSVLLNYVIHYNMRYDLECFRCKVLLFSKNVSISLGLLGIIGIAAGIKFTRQWNKSQRDTEILKKEKLEAELNFLKSQIHPHFIFNTLNNLYALTLKKADNAPDIVLKLSDLLDYMLYNSKDAFISMDKEIEMIRNYVELEKLRYGTWLDVKMDIQGDIEGKMIPPLIIFPFVENSIKHGINVKAKSSEISIDMKVNPGILIFKIRNTKERKGNECKDYKGIGLENVKRRLELLYPQNHVLKILDKEDTFEVYLEIKN